MTTNALLPNDLIKSVASGNATLILWHNFDARSQRLPDYLNSKLNPNALIRKIIDDIDSDLETTPALKALARLPVSNIFTTAYDSRVEECIRDQNIVVHTVGDDSDLHFGLSASAEKYVFHLLGTPKDAESLVITQRAYNGLPFSKSNLVGYLANELESQTCIFLGLTVTEFDGDSLLSTIYSKLAASLKRDAQPPFLVCVNPANELHERDSDAQKVILLNMTDAEFLINLEKAVNSYELSQGKVDTYEAQVAALPLPESPYKFLNYFEAKDRRIYFGRELESIELSRQIVANRFTILSSPSGRGKTSLLKAGVIPRLEAAGWQVRLFRISEQPQDIRNFFAGLGLSSQSKIVVIVDQAEELFTRADYIMQDRVSFAMVLAECLDNAPGEFRFLVSIRYEYIGAWEDLMSVFVRTDLGINANRFALGSMGKAQAKRAIEEPLKDFNAQIEPTLVEIILGGLETTDFDPAQLQILCYTLYKNVDDLQVGKDDQRRLSVLQYQSLGEIQGVLDRYMNDALAHFGDAEQQATAKILLKGMITAQKTKLPLSPVDITKRVSYSGLAHEQVETLLQQLQNERIVRALDNGLFELSHDRLAAKVGEWLTDTDRARLNAAQLLKQGMYDFEHEWQIIGNDAQATIIQAADSLNLNSKEIVVLLISSLHPAVDNRERAKHWLNYSAQLSHKDSLLEAIKSIEGIEFATITSSTPYPRLGKITLLTVQQVPPNISSTVIRAYWLCNPESLRITFELMNEWFDLSEIQTICLWLGIDYEELEQGGKSNKIRSLLKKYAERACIDHVLGMISSRRNFLDFEIGAPPESDMHKCFEVMNSLFSVEEIESLITDYEVAFRGWSRPAGFHSKQAITRSLIQFFNRSGRLVHLRLIMASVRPDTTDLDVVSDLFQALTTNYDFEGIKTLCFDLKIDHENAGSNKNQIITFLIKNVAIENLIYALIDPTTVGKDSIEVMLRRRLNEAADLADLSYICSEFGLNIETIAGTSFSAKCRELVMLLIRLQLIASFMYLCSQKLPWLFSTDTIWQIIRTRSNESNQTAKIFANLLGEDFIERLSSSNVIDKSNYSRAILTILQVRQYEDLRMLCFDLAIDPEDFGVETVEPFARAIVQYMKHRDRVTELADAIIYRWPEFKLPIDEAKTNDPN